MHTPLRHQRCSRSKAEAPLTRLQGRVCGACCAFFCLLCGRVCATAGHGSVHPARNQLLGQRAAWCRVPCQVRVSMARKRWEELAHTVPEDSQGTVVKRAEGSCAVRGPVRQNAQDGQARLWTLTWVRVRRNGSPGAPREVLLAVVGHVLLPARRRPLAVCTCSAQQRTVR